MSRCLFFKLRLAAFIILLPVLARAGGVYCKYDIAIVNRGGVLKPAPGAQIWVCPNSSVGIPCNPSINVFTTGGVGPISNPLTADSNGNYAVCVAFAGRYQLQIGGTGLTTNVQTNTVIPTSLDQGTDVIKVASISFPDNSIQTTAAIQGCVTVVPFSATPVFDGASRCNVFYIALTGNVTSSTFINVAPGVIYTFIWHDAAGGHTIVPPLILPMASPNLSLGPITNIQSFVAQTSLFLYPIGPLMTTLY